jgi:magnesium transporter
MCLVFAKAGVELLLLSIKGNNQFWQWQAWMLVLGLVGFALLQLWYLNKALKLADPTIVCPCKHYFSSGFPELKRSILQWRSVFTTYLRL